MKNERISAHFKKELAEWLSMFTTLFGLLSTAMIMLLVMINPGFSTSFILISFYLIAFVLFTVMEITNLWFASVDAIAKENQDLMDDMRAKNDISKV